MNITELIVEAYENRASLTRSSVSAELIQAVQDALELLDNGDARVAEPTATGWVVNEWLKKAVLLSFILAENRVLESGDSKYYDKVAGKFDSFDDVRFQTGGYRVVPPAMVRHGAYLAPNVILMPSYVTIGAYVGEGTMVGSCAQIGKNVHLSGGVGIGGVLEPLQASPTIIEDNCFIGARSEIVEGVIVEEGSVVSMGVYIGQSTRIFDRANGDVSYGRIPAGSVVVSGTMPAKDGTHSLYCAVIVKKVDEKTRSKVGINELLRDI